MVKSPHISAHFFTLASDLCAHMFLHETGLFIVPILRLLQSELLERQPGHQPTLKMASAWTESRMAPWEEATEHWGIAGLPSWARRRGFSGQERWLWLCPVCACVLSGPHSSVSSYEQPKPPVIQQPQQKLHVSLIVRVRVAHITHLCFRSIRNYFEDL